MLVTIIKLLLYILIPVFNIVVGIVYKIIYYHWDVRKTYQTFLYRFNSYHEFNLIKRQISKYYLKVDFIRLTQYTCLEY